MNLIGPKIRSLREEKGLTQEQLAAQCHLAGWGLSRGTLAKIEAQVRQLTDIEVDLMARVLNVPVGALFEK